MPDPRSSAVPELGPDGRAIGLEEKPEQPKTDLALVRVHLFTPVLHDAVRAVEPSRRGDAEITLRHAEAAPAPSVPRAHRLVLADHSEVQIRSVFSPPNPPASARAAPRASPGNSPFVFPPWACPFPQDHAPRREVLSWEAHSRYVPRNRLLPGLPVRTGAGNDSGTSADPDGAGPTSSGAFSGPAARTAYRALGHDRWTEVASASHRDRRSALHEALPHIRKEISQ